MICLYAMHIYDLVFYARLTDALNHLGLKFAFKLLITCDTYQIPGVANFTQATFPNFLIIPTKAKDNSGILCKISSLFRLRAWIKRHVNSECVLILNDKSSPLSRALLKRSSNAFLIQQIEAIGGDYAFDLQATVLDALKCIALGAYFARWYVSSSSGGFVRALKTTAMHQNIITFYHVSGSTEPTCFYLPPLRAIRKEKVIVIFGSRFLSWPHFRSGNFEQRLELLSSIYAFINTSFRNHNVIYLPHPLENGCELEFVSSIFSGRVEALCNYFSSEHYLYENRNVDCTFSIGSTSSVSAFGMGYDSKVFYRMFNFSSTVESTYDRIFTGLPPSVFANRIDDLVKPCVHDAIRPESNCLASFAKKLFKTA